MKNFLCVLLGLQKCYKEYNKFLHTVLLLHQFTNIFNGMD